VMQSASLFGAYSLSFLTILLGASLAEFCAARRRIAAPALMLALFAGLWVYGALRLAAGPAGTVPDVVMRLVQPDVPQNEKYVRRYVTRNWQRLLDLSRAPGKVTHIVWPEAAPPFLLDRSAVALGEIAALTQGGRSLITGSARAARDGTRSRSTIPFTSSGPAAGRKRSMTNSIWCRSANMCRSPIFSAASASPS